MVKRSYEESMKIREPNIESIKVKYLNQDFIIPTHFKHRCSNFIENYNRLIFSCQKCFTNTYMQSGWRLSYGHKPSNNPKVISSGKWAIFCSEKCMNQWLEENQVKLVTEQV